MAVQTVTLTGDALTGIAVSAPHAAKVAALPQTVCLGRRYSAMQPKCLKLGAYMTSAIMAKVPDEADWYTKAAESISHMYQNDRYGCCVISGKGHSLGGWSANDADSGAIVIATDQEIYSQYQSICGPGDNGCYIPEVLDHFRDQGIKAGGKTYTIEGYVSVDWTSKELVKAAIALFGPCTIGFMLPGSWSNSNVWDVTSSGIVGGHDVSPFGYGKVAALSTTAEGVVVSSWGRLYLMTWAAFTSRKWIDQMFVMLPKGLWTGTDNTSPLGAKLDKLRADLAVLNGGGIPEMPDPTPEEIDWRTM